MCAALLLPFCASARAGTALEGIKASDMNAMQTAGSPEASQPAQREWTVMAYIVGNDSRLEDAAIADMQALEADGSGEKVAVVAELGLMNWKKLGETDERASRRYLVQKTTAVMAGLVSEPLQTIPGADMGDYRHLADFITWAKTNYPARHYILYLHGHGSGWRDDGKARAVAYDDASGNFITAREFGETFRLAGGVDIVYSISCLTQMMENLYELRGSVGYMVGSEENNSAVVTLPDGTRKWTSFEARLPYLLLAQHPEMPPLDLAAEIPLTIAGIWGKYSAKETLTFSAVDISALAELGARLDGWAASAESLGDSAAAAAAKKNTIRFNEFGSMSALRDSVYSDLPDFVRTYAAAADPAAPGAADFSLATSQLLEFISDKVVITNTALGKRKDGTDYSRAGGLAITVPAHRPNAVDVRLKTYEDLAFAKEHSWDKFIFKYLWPIDDQTGFAPAFEARGR